MIIFQQALKLVKHIDNSISDFSILARLHRFNLIYFASNEKERFTCMTIYISEKKYHEIQDRCYQKVLP